MSPRRISASLIREAPLLRENDSVGDAVGSILRSGLPALPVVDAEDGLTGLFGEREFMVALFPGYVAELRFAGFVPRSLDEALKKRAACRREPVSQHMNTERVDVPADASDTQVAETFLHHRVLVVPVCEGGRVIGIITRGDFFAKLVEHFLGHDA